MSVINCPECDGKVSESASSCPHCGYPISDYIKEMRYNNEIKRLTDKIKAVDFVCPSPRARVCIKCGSVFMNANNIHADCYRKPSCDCEYNGIPYPGVEVDYPEQGATLFLGVEKYILEHDIIPRNIGDKDSREYKEMIEEIESSNCIAIPPDPKDFGVYASTDPLPEYIPLAPKQEPLLPHCPFCQSTNLTKISSIGKAIKISLFGLYGMDDAGKTYRCNNCGGRF